MSKRKGQRKKRSRKKRRPVPASPLEGLAAALNACDKAGLRVRFMHGIAYSDTGVVVPRKGKWVARRFVTSPDTPLPEPDDLDD